MLDTIVIGAGAAGLAAARDLSSAGKSVAILEARQRIGGRIFTLHESNLPLPIELGAEFIHGEAEETFKIVESAALLAYELPNNLWMSEHGKFRRMPDFWATTKRIRMKIPARGRDVSFAEFLEMQRNLSPRLKAMMLNFAEGYNAAHAERLSAKSLRATADEEDHPTQWRIGDGYDSVIESIRAGLDPSRSTLHLGCEATDVKWSRGSVQVLTRKGETFHAAAAVVTIPIGVWKSADAIQFDPPLREKERALRTLEVGHVVKIVFSFHERFWDPEHVFVVSRDPFMPTWWTMSPIRASMLTGWAGGHAADRMLASQDLTDRALKSLSSVFGVKRREIDSKLDSVHVHNWQADPFSRGAYSYAGVGGELAHETLARQVEGTLFFAGEATTPDETGTVTGAIGTGRRAAKQVLKSLAK